jgi:hypothetical protein
MSSWDWESFDEIINHGLFKVTQPGPLRAPIKSFSVHRNERLELILETETAEGAMSTTKPVPSGTVRINTEKVEFKNISGITASAGGVAPFAYATSANVERGTQTVKETAQVSYVEGRLQDADRAKYTIDWLENVSSKPFVWPHSINAKNTTVETRTLTSTNDGITLSGTSGHFGGRRTCVRFAVAGMQVYLCASWQEASDGRVKPGCLVYLGTPDENVRSRIRNALSFSLGMYLVHLGSTLFAEDWEIVSFKSVAAYSIDRRVFDLVVLPPATFGGRFQHEIVPAALSRMVNSIYSAYDDLKFRSLSWAYWHALCATVHIAPVHFGAAIEALQRRYIAAHPVQFRTKLVADKRAWSGFAKEIGDAISRLQIPESDKRILLENVGGLNRVSHRLIAEQVLKSIGIELGPDESSAWRRRDDAAHGNEIEDGTELEAIRDMKLLNVLFHRMLLKITDAADSYFDYCTPGFPIRNLREPVPPAS